MGDSVLVSVLLYGHIASAMAFFGGAVAFAFGVGPSLVKMMPTSRRDVMVNLFHNFANMMLVFAALLAVFGAALVYTMTNGDLSRLNPSDPWGLRIAIGATIGLAVELEAFLLIAPSVKGMAKIAREMPADGSSPPPARFLQLQSRVVHASVISPFLMLAAVGFMVSAAGL